MTEPTPDAPHPEKAVLAVLATPAVVATPATPAQESQTELRTSGQRRINLIWEVTQAIIAVIVATGTLYIAAVLVLRSDASAGTAFLLLSNAFFMIVTAYFQRTNHTRVGGPSGRSDER